MLPLCVTLDCTGYAKLFSLREERNYSNQKIHHEHRNRTQEKSSIRSELLLQLKIQKQAGKRTFLEYTETTFFDDDLCELGADTPAESNHCWRIPFPEASYVGLLPQWKVGDVEFRGCGDWLLAREELSVRPEGTYHPHVISDSLQRHVEDYSSTSQEDCSADGYSRPLASRKGGIPDLVTDALINAGLPVRSCSTKALSLDWQIADFAPKVPESRIQLLADCLPRENVPSRQRNISVLSTGGDVVDDGLREISDGTAVISTCVLLPWTHFLPEMAETYAQNGCVETGMLMSDLASSRTCSGASRPWAIISASALLAQHSDSSGRMTTMVRHETEGIWAPNYAALERLVDLQSPWQLLPLRRREAALPAKPIVTKAALEVLVPRLQAKRGFKHRLSELITHSPPYPSVDLSELDVEEDSRLAKRRRRAAKRTPSRDLTRFVDVAIAECQCLSPEPHRREPREPVKAAVAPHTETARQTSTPAQVPQDCASQPQAASVPPDGVNAQKDHPGALQTQSVRRDAHCAPATTPTAPPAPTQHTPSPPSADFALPGFSTEGLMEQYMRLQRGESTDTGLARSGAGFYVHQVTPQRGSVQPPHRPGPGGSGIPISPSSAGAVPVQVSPPAASGSVRSRIAQLAARNEAHFREAGVRLDVLVSERFLEEQAHAAGEIAGTYGINLVDCPLEEPLSFILDATTAVCVLSVDAVTDRTQLKVLVKQLTSITFKFAKIYMVLTLEHDVDCNSAVLQLCQTLMRFPAPVMLCQCTASPTAVAQMIHQLCRHCMRDCCASGPDATTAKYLQRPFLDHLQRAEGNFLSHCEYLQRFPTVNFFLACALLHYFPLRDLLRQTPAALCSYLRAQHVCTGETEVMVASFLQLVSTHAGLGACI